MIILKTVVTKCTIITLFSVVTEYFQRGELFFNLIEQNYRAFFTILPRVLFSNTLFVYGCHLIFYRIHIYEWNSKIEFQKSTKKFLERFSYTNGFYWNIWFACECNVCGGLAVQSFIRIRFLWFAALFLNTAFVHEGSSIIYRIRIIRMKFKNRIPKKYSWKLFVLRMDSIEALDSHANATCVGVLR